MTRFDRSRRCFKILTLRSRDQVGQTRLADTPARLFCEKHENVHLIIWSDTRSRVECVTFNKSSRERRARRV
jgi:hypothetical protein